MIGSDPIKTVLTRRIKALLYAVLILAAVPVSAARTDLTGRWSCNDGGTYYLRQTGSTVHWYGEAGTGRQPAWARVFSGRIADGRINGRWTDVPKGRSAGSGSLVLVIEKQGTVLRALEKTGGFGGSRWVRQPAEAAAPRRFQQSQTSEGEDCVNFDPAAIRLRQVNGRWKLVEGSRWLFDFGTDRAAAQMALQVIERYRMNRSCFVGRPDPSFTYLLAKGGIPAGPMAGEDCLAFDPLRIRVSKIQKRWKIVEGRHWLFDFGKNEGEARHALAIIKRYGFTRSCFVGRPKAEFTYLRR